MKIEKNNKKKLSNFIILFLTQYISLIGSMIVSFAVIWYLTIESDSTLILSLSSVCNIVPMIIIGPFAGIIADKLNKNYILIISDLIQAIATFGLVLLFNFGIAELWHILALLTVRGFMQGIQMPVSAALTPIMVPKKKIQKVNAIDQVLRSLLMIGTPAIGAFLIVSYSIQKIYWLDVLTVIPPIIALIVIKIPKVNQKNNNEKEKISFKKEFAEGFHYINSEGLTSIFVMFSTANFIVVPILSLFPLLISNYHLGTVSQYGFVELIFHVGFLIGSMLLIIKKSNSTMKSVVKFGVLFSFVMLAYFFTPSGLIWMVYLVTFILGINITMIDTQLMSVLQSNIPHELQGRVFATMFTIVKSLNPLGLIIWGVIGEFIPVQWIFLIAPIISLFVYFFLLKKTDIIDYGAENKDNFDVEKGESTKMESPGRVVVE